MFFFQTAYMKVASKKRDETKKKAYLIADYMVLVFRLHDAFKRHSSGT